MISSDESSQENLSSQYLPPRRLTLRLTDREYEHISQIAAKTHASLSWVIRFLISEDIVRNSK